jgi:hypothetical protein
VANQKPEKPASLFILGLDLGQSQDFTALAAIEKSWGPRPDDPTRQVGFYAVRHLKRWPLKTSYTDITNDLVRLVQTSPLAWPVLTVDKTGVGTAVIDLLVKAQLAAWIRPVLITGGHQTAAGADGSLHVPKKELVSSLQVVLQSRRLLVAAMPERELLIKELLAFRVKITAAANETFEAWRERDHDDMVLAVALAIWYGGRYGGPCARLDPAPVVRRTIADRMAARSAASRWGLFGRKY